ncbi:MAG: hypothetical protein Q8N88_01495 [Nanoarchaeota archaeon]|nr:hypothetical protein [Nanoarchaeota archaeon]
MSIREYSDIGVLELYRKLPNLPNNPKIVEFITEISRDQFQIAVPENNKDIIEFKTGDVAYQDYPIFFFSKKYEEIKIKGEVGFTAKKVKKGERISVTRKELEDISDMIVVGLGGYMGKEGDPRRRFLMYITPQIII